MQGDFKNIKFWGELISQCEGENQSHLPENLLELGFKEMGGEDFKHLLKTALDAYCDPSRFRGEKAAALRNFRYQILKQIQELEKRWRAPGTREPPLPSAAKPTGPAPSLKLELREEESSSKKSKPLEETDPWGEKPL